jgi:hypothetical protein
VSAGSVGVIGEAKVIGATVGKAEVTLAGVQALSAQAWPVDKLIGQQQITPSCSFSAFKVTTLDVEISVSIPCKFLSSSQLKHPSALALCLTH